MLTYCTNIHPAESWQETFAQLGRHIPEIRDAVSPNRLFPIGLRLSHRAAFDIGPNELDIFAAWCDEHRAFVPTINGFPFGAFHGTSVKQNVYLPDWRDPKRVAYTNRLGELLSSWLPEEIIGSISTVPLGFKSEVGWDDLPTLTTNIAATLEHLDRLREKSGKTVILALEPEPGCLLETTDDVLRLFSIIDPTKAPFDLLGICFDCCHQAVLFEDPKAALARILGAGIRIPKLHVSSGLRLKRDARRLIANFDEPTYLHQIAVRRSDGAVSTYEDIPDALAEHADAPGDEWRVHFHVPIFYGPEADAGTTQLFTETAVRQMAGKCLLEVETYTWSVLPRELRLQTVEASIVREMRWVEEVAHAE